jgi:GTP cyclohydrolase I
MTSETFLKPRCACGNDPCHGGEKDPLRSRYLPRENMEKIAQGVRLILEAVGEEPDGVHFRDTPHRVARMYDAVLSGRFSPGVAATSFPETGYKGIILVRGVRFYAFCAHHMAPFHGTADVAYLPALTDTKLVGLSKLVRLLRQGCKLFTTQESVTRAAREAIEKAVPNRGVIVRAVAEHSCMSTRGVLAHGAETVTMDYCGEFETSGMWRQTFLDLARKG